MKGYCTVKEEWLYPDQTLEELPERVVLHSAKNGREGIRLLLESGNEKLNVSLNGKGFTAELFEMVDVFVGYNEAETEEQNGMFVITADEYEKPDYCTRKAPFRVYEALRPLQSDELAVKHGLGALYLTLTAQEETAAGIYELELRVGEYRLIIQLHLYEVRIPEESLGITNWFSLDNVALRHDLVFGSEAYYSMLRRYARAMRRTRQTHFFISYDHRRLPFDKAEGKFDFSYLKPIIGIFFEEGFSVMEFGNFATRGGDMFTDEMKCNMDPSVCVSSDEGYHMQQNFIRGLASFLKENGWEKKVIFHIFDEPDVHLKDRAALEKRKQQYLRISNLLRRHLPGCRIIEAVKTTEFKAGVDIWVPLSANYEEQKADFDKLLAAGEEVWVYVCCVPTGCHLNRFLDIDLIKSRLLFWGCARYGLTGYLHWGFNYWPEDAQYDPFECSNTPNAAFHGIYPSGDAYIVYPGEDGPLPGMRLEAQRRGAEDYELLLLLKSVKPMEYERLMKKTLRGFSDYNADAEAFEETRRELLSLLDI